MVENGQIVVRPMNYLAMSYDHRIIDGREAVLGLVAMKDALKTHRVLLVRSCNSGVLKPTSARPAVGFSTDQRIP